MPSNQRNDKIKGHRKHVVAGMKLMKEDFLFNRFLSADAASVAGVAPFVFVVTIVADNRITVKSITIQGKSAGEDDIEVKEGKITVTIKAFVSTSTFVLSIEAIGEAFAETTFNLTCDDDKVFKEDQKIKIQSSGRGGYFNEAVKLP